MSSIEAYRAKAKNSQTLVLQYHREYNILRAWPW
jgi:hypothetical protein